MHAIVLIKLMEGCSNDMKLCMLLDPRVSSIGAAECEHDENTT